MRLFEGSRLPGYAKALALLLAVAVLVAAALVLVPRAQAQGSPETDRQMLTGLYWALGGKDWDRSDDWLSDAPLDQWYGVATDSDGRVTGLDLSGNGLTGKIPGGLSVLFDPSDFDIRLKELDLSNNRLSGKLPSGFVPLFPHLEVLKASGNQFSGTIPSDVPSLSKLTWLDLDNNDFSGTIPSGLGSLSNLTVLRLGGNDFSGPIPAELGRLSNLSILGLGNNRLEKELPAELGNLSSLTRLSVWNNGLSGKIPPELGKLSALTKLNLGSNRLEGPIPEELAQLTNLDELSLSGNPGLTGCIPASLEGQLTSYNFGGLPFCAPAHQAAGDWLLIGAAERTPSGGVALTTGGEWQVGALFYPQPVTSRNLGVGFSFEIAGQGRRADGIAVVMARNLPDDDLASQSVAGGQLGNDLFTQAIAVEFDTFENSWDTSDSHIGLSLMGTEITDHPLALAATPLDQDLRNSGVYEAEVVLYESRFGVYLSNSEQGVDRDLVLGVAIPEFVPFEKYIEEYYIGFVATTGANTDRHIIHNVYLAQGDGVAVTQSAATPTTPIATATPAPTPSPTATPELTPTLTPEPAPTPTPATPTPAPTTPIGGYAAHPDDVAALTALYEATGGPNWTNSDDNNWLTTTSLNQWAGVEVNWSGRVYRLTLANNNLGDVSGLGRAGRSTATGQLPPDLDLLSSLVVLDLSNNQLKGEIPDSLADLPMLQSLSLHGNQFFECIPLDLPGLVLPTERDVPSEFCTPDRDVLEILYNSTGGGDWKSSTNWLTNRPLDEWDGIATDNSGRVVGITLAENGLKGEIPPELSQLEKLEVLELDGNELYGSIPAELGKLSALILLDLSRNNLGLDSGGRPLEDGIPPELGQLENLQILNLRDNYIFTVIPEELGGLHNLKYLDVFGNNLVGCIPRELEDVFSLSVSTGLRSTDQGLNLGWVHRIGQIALQIEDAIVDFNSWTKFAFKFLPRPVKGIVVSPNQLGLALGSRLADWLENRGEFTSNDFDVNMPLCAPTPPAPTTEWENQTLETDRQALIDLWAHLGGTRRNDDGEPWWTLRNWGDEDIRNWEGVTVESVETLNGSVVDRVVELDLSGTILNGKLDSPKVAGALGSLGQLRKLDLSHDADISFTDNALEILWGGNRESRGESQLTGKIPESIGNLFLLQELDLSGHGTRRVKEFTGTIPPELGNLAFLKELDVSHNTFEGSLPRELGNLHFLSDFNVNNSGLTGCLPEIMRGRFETEVWVQTLVVGMQVIPAARVHKVTQIKNALEGQGKKIANNTAARIARSLNASQEGADRVKAGFERGMERALSGYKFNDVSIVKGAPAAIGTEGKLIGIVSEDKPRAVLGKEVQLYCR